MSRNNPLFTPAYKGIEDPTDKNKDSEAIDVLPFLEVQREAIINSSATIREEYQGAWNGIYRAMRNEHSTNSKYRKRAYRARSQIFRPKTQSAVRKNLSSTATALFATENAVQISPQYDDDPKSKAQAVFLHELVNYRISRNSRRNGIPFFETIIGARYDSQITGVCCAKAHWEYTQRTEIQETEEHDELTGETVITETEVKVKQFDRPRVILIPPENPIISSAASWINPAQNSPFFYVPWQMSVDEIRTKMEEENEQNPESQWYDFSEAEIQSKGAANGAEDTGKSIKQSRDKVDRKSDAGHQPTGYEMATVYECFITYRGEDYHYWSLGINDYLTDPRPTRESYPSFHGERPYVIGKATIEPHRLYPMSPAESWKPLQDEANDLVNLRVDALKQVIAPITKVKRGKKVDLAAVQRRGPGSTIMVHDLEDVSIETAGSINGNAYTESAHLNADFDELAGVFSASSVQTSRSMNETVGGMRLMSGSANGLTEYDLRVFAETFVQPLVRMIVMLEQYYENDETVLKIAGKKAMLREKYGVDQLTDEFMMKEVHTTVDIGIGASDPAQRQAKWMGTIDMLKNTADVWAKDFELNSEEILLECFGVGGYKNGERFIKGEKKPQPPTPDPSIEQAKLRFEAEKMKDSREGEKIEAGKQSDRQKLIKDLIVELLNQQQAEKSLEMQGMKQNVDMLGSMMDRFTGAEEKQTMADTLKASQQQTPNPNPQMGNME